MIELVTGLPGNGKTLMTIGQVKARAEAENRPVFYNGIAELNIPGWEVLDDPKEWMKVPPRSIVVLDEAQKTFRNRSVSASPPAFVTELETHRHLGIDLVMITQHPSLVDPAVRRLAGKHQHCVRIWGMEASTVHSWASVKDNCDKSRADSEKRKYAFDKSLYGLYKSAEVHTMKRAIPTRVKLLIAVPFLLAAAGYYVYNTMVAKKAAIAAPQGPVMTSTQYSSVPGGGQGASQVKQPFDRLADAKNFVDMSTPRVEGLQHTAPKYDQLTAPVRVPVPAMCVQIGKVSSASSKPVTCKCYSQQGTALPVEFNMCIDFARNGFFQEFDADREAANRGASSAPGATSQPVVQADASASTRVAVIPDVPPAARETRPISK